MWDEVFDSRTQCPAWFKNFNHNPMTEKPNTLTIRLGILSPTHIYMTYQTWINCGSCLSYLLTFYGVYTYVCVCMHAYIHNILIYIVHFFHGFIHITCTYTYIHITHPPHHTNTQTYLQIKPSAPYSRLHCLCLFCSDTQSSAVCYWLLSTCHNQHLSKIPLKHVINYYNNKVSVCFGERERVHLPTY